MTCVCPACGTYKYPELDQDETIGKAPRHLLSHYIRRQFDQSGQPVVLAAPKPGTAASPRLVELPVSEKLKLAILAIADRTPEFGKESTIDQETDWPLVQAHTANEFGEMLQYLCQSGSLRETSRHIGTAVSKKYLLTGDGWKQIEALRPTYSLAGHQAFVAMWFDDSLDSLYNDAIAPGLRAGGWEPWRAKGPQFEEKICDRIVTEIRRSSLLLIDCTGQRPNAFFEAGLAMGLGIPIIWCARKDVVATNQLAFDTRQYPHLDYDSPEQLRQMITNRVRALYPREARS